MDRLTVSVIVAVRNGARSLPRCLAALRRQDYDASDWETIVVDDGSEDEAAAVVSELVAAWRRPDGSPALRVLRQPWAGAAAARNRGVANASGDIVAFTDADCEPEARWLSRLAAPLGDPDVAAVAGGYLSRQTSWVARLSQAEFDRRYAMLRSRDRVDVAFTHSAAFRRSVFDELGGFDERFPNNGDDLEIAFRLAAAGRTIVFAADALVYHHHPETLLGYMRKKFGRGYWRMLVYKQFPGKALKDSYTPQLLKIQVALAGVTAGLGLARAFVDLDGLWPAVAGSAAALVASTVPFALQLREPLHVRLAAPLFLLCRAFALGLGTLCGLFHRIDRYETGGRRNLASR